MREHPLAIQTLYAQLLQICQSSPYPGDGFAATGDVRAVSKIIHGATYWYAQYTDPRGIQVQHYIGAAADTTVQRTLARLEDEDARAEAVQRMALVKALVQSGYIAPTRAAAGALQVLERIGVFRSGCVMIGTPAYGVILNMLGYREHPAVLTNDLDLSFSRYSLAVTQMDIEQDLFAWEPKLFAVPQLNRRHAEVSLKVRGQDFHIDFLTPGRIDEDTPIKLPSGIHAQPLPFLDYLVNATQQAAALAPYGALVNVPEPARFMWHKLAVAAMRPAAFAAKRKKDLHQAAALFKVLSTQNQDDASQALRRVKKSMDGRHLAKAICKTLSAPEMKSIEIWVRTHCAWLFDDAAAPTQPDSYPSATSS
ncbi:MAG: GSU2403 family nucleotidyltransferase fold protein [Thiomonas sp.]